MLPGHETTPAVEAVLALFEEARWISGYRFEKGSGYFLHWTITGHQHAALLQEVVKRHRLNEGLRAVDFTGFCSAEPDHPDEWQSSPEERDFWLGCVRELRLSADPEKLNAMSEVIAAWQPRLPPTGQDNH